MNWRRWDALKLQSQRRAKQLYLGKSPRKSPSKSPGKAVRLIINQLPTNTNELQQKSEGYPGYGDPRLYFVRRALIRGVEELLETQWFQMQGPKQDLPQ